MTQPVITERMSFKQQIIKLLFLYVYKLFHSRLCVWQQIQLQRTFVVVNMGVIKKEIFLTERSEFFSAITYFLLHELCPSQDSLRGIFPEHIYTNLTTQWLIRGWNDCTPF